MRKVVYGGACSLDGYFAGKGGAIDWLHFSRDVEEVMAKSWAAADTILMGRKTWQAAADQGGGGGSMPGVTTYIFSRTLKQLPDSGADLISTDAAEFVRDLKKKPGKDMIVMSGGNLASSLFAAGLIDEVGLNIHPVLLGSGVPAFLDSGARVGLELTECRSLDGGCVLVTYRVKQPA